MANNSNHSYVIDLDVKSTESSKRALKELQTAFTGSKNSVMELNRAYAQIAESVKDTTELDRQYNKVINDRIKDREKEIDKIRAIQIGIINNNKLSESQRKNLLNNTEKRIELAQKEIDTLNRSNLVSTKAELKKLKALKEEEALRKKLSTYVKQDLNAIKDKIKKQFEFIKMLKTTEGRYRAIKKAAATAVKVGGKVAKAGFRVGAGAAGLAMGLAGAAVAGEERTQQKADALRSLKSGVKPEVLDSVYIKTGADYTTIVEAINRVAGLVGNKDVEKFAVAEIQNPGIGKLMAMQGKVDDNIDYMNVMNQIRKSTGLQDASAVIDATSSSRLVKNGEISQFDHMQAMASLTQVGIDPETAERMITHIARNKGDKSFIDAFNSTDLSKLVYDKGLKNTLKNSDIKLENIDYTKEGLEETPEQKAARETAEQLRRFELEKDKMLASILPGILPLIKAMMKVAQTVMPTILTALGSLVKGLGIVVKWVEEQLELDSGIGKAMEEAGESMRNAAEEMKKANQRAETEENQRRIMANREELSTIIDKFKSVLPGGQQAQGGLITSPSIVGETGQPELVIPLDHSRFGRANQIINNFTTSQTFNMMANQQTPLAFASAVGQNRFVQRTKVF